MPTIISNERPAVVVIQAEGDIIQTSLDTQTETITFENDAALSVAYSGLAQQAANNSLEYSENAQNSATEANEHRIVVAAHLADVGLDLEAVQLHRFVVEGLASQVAIDRVSVQDNAIDVNTRQANVQLLHGEVVDLRNQTAADRSYVTSTAAQVDADATQVDADATQVAADRAQVQTLATQVSADTATVATDRAAVQALHDETQDNALEVGVNLDAVTTHAAQVATNTGLVQANTDQVSAQHTQISDWRDETEGFRNESETFRDEAQAAALATAGGLKPIGSWDASTNTDPPAPTDDVAPWYRVTVAGTVPAVGEVAVGDNIYWSADQSTWFKIDNTEKFTSINGFTSGDVVLNASHVEAIPASKEGSGNGLDADLLDGQHGSHYLDFDNATNKPSPSLTLQGDVSGTASFSGLASATMDVTVGDDSHNHSFSTVTGLQAALDAKQATITGAATTIISSDLSTDRVLIADGSGKVSVSTVTPTELGYSSGGTSNFQAQINDKANGADLGTAAGADTTTSGADNTSGRVLRVEDANNKYLGLTGGTLTGALTATSFSGAGTSLTAIDPANIATTASYRFVTDAQISTWDTSGSAVGLSTSLAAIVPSSTTQITSADTLQQGIEKTSAKFTLHGIGEDLPYLAAIDLNDYVTPGMRFAVSKSSADYQNHPAEALALAPLVHKSTTNTYITIDVTATTVPLSKGTTYIICQTATSASGSVASRAFNTTVNNWTNWISRSVDGAFSTLDKVAVPVTLTGGGQVVAASINQWVQGNSALWTGTIELNELNGEESLGSFFGAGAVYPPFMAFPLVPATSISLACNPRLVISPYVHGGDGIKVITDSVSAPGVYFFSGRAGV